MTKPHIRIDNDLFQAILTCDFKKRQLKIILLIYRLSIGCQREWAKIPRKCDFEAIGITKNNIDRQLQWLINHNIILNKGNMYRINDNIDEWQMSPVITYEPGQIRDLISLNLGSQNENFSPDDGSQNENLSSQNENFSPDDGSQNENLSSQNENQKDGESSQKKNFEVLKKRTSADTNLATAIDKSIINSLSVCLSDRQQRHVNLYVTLHKSINPQTIQEIRSFLDSGKSDDEIEFAIRESHRRGGKSANYLRGIIENREIEGKNLPPPAAAPPAAPDDLAALREMPAPDIPAADAWAMALEVIRPDISRHGFDALFADCRAVRWEGCCLIISRPPGTVDASYRGFNSLIKRSLIRVLDSDDVGFEFESEVQYAEKT